MAKLSTEVHRYIVKNFNLSVPTINVLRMHIGLLIMKDHVFACNSIIQDESGYSYRSITYAWKQLEENGLIQRTGFSYRRRISKGEKLVQIISELSSTKQEHMGKRCLEENCTPRQEMPSTRQEMPSTRHDMPIIHDHSKINTTNNGAGSPRVVVIISSEIDKRILEANKINPISSEHIKNENDVLDLVKFILDRREDEYTLEQRVNGVIKFIKNGTLDIPKGWINQKVAKENEGRLEYQEYYSQAVHDVKIGAKPSDYHVLNFHEWKGSSLRSLH